MHIYLETERLLLRRFTDADLDDLVALNSDPEVMLTTPEGVLTRSQTEHEYFPAYFAQYERGDRYGFWAAIERAAGNFLGWFHFLPDAEVDPDEPELGYRLHKAAWGKGYATDGSRALIDKGFAELGVRRVVAYTDPDHLASRRVMEKSGMRHVRTHRGPSPHGGEWDTVEYALGKGRLGGAATLLGRFAGRR